MHSELRLLVVAPQELECRLLTLLAALGESHVSSDWRSASPGEWDAVFWGPVSGEQNAWVLQGAARHLKRILVVAEQ